MFTSIPSLKFIAFEANEQCAQRFKLLSWDSVGYEGGAVSQFWSSELEYHKLCPGVWVWAPKDPEALNEFKWGSWKDQIRILEKITVPGGKDEMGSARDRD